MSHFAELDENNIVIRVLVGDNNDPNGDEGYQWFVENLGGRWIKTSYNGNIRYNYGRTGSYYDEEADAFIHPQPYPSWILNKTNYQWEPPQPYPADGGDYQWNEQTKEWEPWAM